MKVRHWCWIFISIVLEKITICAYHNKLFSLSILFQIIILTHPFLMQPSTSLYPPRDLKNHFLKLPIFSFSAGLPRLLKTPQNSSNSSKVSSKPSQLLKIKKPPELLRKFKFLEVPPQISSTFFLLCQK